MAKTIKLRVIGFNHDGNFQFVCLDTDIAVSSETLEGAKSKMREALVSYFQSFSEQEMEGSAFVRHAPTKYWALFYFLSIAGFVKNLAFFFSSEADYDPHSHNLSLA